MRTYLCMHINGQRVAPHQAAWGVYQHVMANRIAFRVEALQNAQRPGVRVARYRTAGFNTVVQRKLCVPGHVLLLVGIRLLGSRNGGRVVALAAVEEQVHQHRSNGRQQNAGLNERMDAVRHPLFEVGCNQGHHANTQ